MTARQRAQKLISESRRTTSVITTPGNEDQALFNALRARAIGDAEYDGETVHVNEFWGGRRGREWRVHITHPKV